MYINESGLISIILPTYNNGHLIWRAIESVIAQTYTNWELIIVDYQSKDNTFEVVNKYEDDRIKFLLVDNNGVVANSRNEGLKVAKGEFAAFLDSDDWWTNDKLMISIDFLNKGFDLIYHDMWLISEPDEVNDPKRIFRTKQLLSPISVNLLIKGNQIINSSVVLRTKVLRTVGLLDENPNIIASEDYDLWVRIGFSTQKFHRIPKCLGFYWYAGNNISKKRNMAKAGRLILEKNMSFLTYNQFLNAQGYNDYSEGIYYLRHDNYKMARQLFIKSVIRSSWSIKVKAIFRWIKLLNKI